MQLAYFVFDSNQQLQRISREAMEQLWEGRRSAEELGCELDDELRLISALLDHRLLPVVCYFVRLQVQDGRITRDSKIEAFEAMSNQQRRRYDHPSAHRQFAGWPPDWQRQLAVALDVPASQLNKLGLGGPLLMSELWGVPLEKVIAYFEEAYEE